MPPSSDSSPLRTMASTTRFCQGSILIPIDWPVASSHAMNAGACSSMRRSWAGLSRGLRIIESRVFVEPVFHAFAVPLPGTDRDNLVGAEKLRVGQMLIAIQLAKLLCRHKLVGPE